MRQEKAGRAGLVEAEEEAQGGPDEGVRVTSQ